jgi:hypothetical protein
MLYGWIEVGLSNNTLFRNETDQDIIVRTIYNNKIILGNTNGTSADAALYILGNNVGIKKVPDSNVLLDVDGLSVLKSLQVGLSNNPTEFTINGDIILKDKARNFDSNMELKCINNNNYFEMFYNNVKRVKITDGLGIDLNDNVYITNDVFANAFQLTSDERFKQNIVNTTFSNDIDILKQIQVKDFQMIAHPEKPVKGFIAQQIESIFPQAILEKKGYIETKGILNDIKTIDTNQILALNTSVLQSLLSRIETLEKFMYENK